MTSIIINRLPLQNQKYLIYSRTWASFQCQRRKWKADALLMYLFSISMVSFENVCRVTYETSSLIKKCTSSICLSLLFVSYFWSNYNGPRTKVFDFSFAWFEIPFNRRALCSVGIASFFLIGHYRNVRGLGKSMVIFRLFEKLRYSNERSTIF